MNASSAFTSGSQTQRRQSADRDNVLAPPALPEPMDPAPMPTPAPPPASNESSREAPSPLPDAESSDSVQLQHDNMPGTSGIVQASMNVPVAAPVITKTSHTTTAATQPALGQAGQMKARESLDGHRVSRRVIR